MKTFRTLDLAVEFHDQIESLIGSSHLKSQILRASSSIALNLAEGNAKFSVAEKRRFYTIAYSSLKECQTALKLMKIEDPQILKRADHLGACLYKLMKSDLKTVSE